MFGEREGAGRSAESESQFLVEPLHSLLECALVAFFNFWNTEIRSCSEAVCSALLEANVSYFQLSVRSVITFVRLELVFQVIFLVLSRF